MQSLDITSPEFRRQLYRVSDIVADLYTDIGNKKVYTKTKASDIKSLFKEPLPLEGTMLEEIFEQFSRDIVPNTALHYSPHFYAWITSNSSQAAIMADFLAAALNVNATTFMNAASAGAIEQEIIRWTGQFIHYHENCFGGPAKRGDLQPT